MKVSLRFHNDTYAPGVATYGIDGAPGAMGTPGTGMFFALYDLTDEDKFKTFAQKITSRLLPTDIDNVLLNRPYINGDLFVTSIGEIYELTDINELTLNTRNNNLGSITNYLLYRGSFTPSNTDAPFKDFLGDTIREKKITISESSLTDVTVPESDALLQLIKTDAQSLYNFIKMSALYGAAPDITLTAKYDDSLKAFVLESDYPIVINSNLYVNQKTEPDESLSQYSPVLTNKNNITEFVGTCRDEISFSVDSSIYSYTKPDSSIIYYGSIYSVTLNDGTEKEGSTGESQNLDRYYTDSSIVIHFLNNQFLDFLLYRSESLTYYFKQDYDYVKLNDLINKIKYDDLNNIQVSAINGVEVYLKKDNVSITGFNL